MRTQFSKVEAPLVLGPCERLDEYGEKKLTVNEKEESRRGKRCSRALGDVHACLAYVRHRGERRCSMQGG
jgi:hypothetical protein